MAKCLNCGSDLVQMEGRRPKKFCDNKGKCRNKYWRDNKPKEKKYFRSDEVEKLKKKAEGLEKELELERQNRLNPLINAARGRDENGVNNDEMKGEVSVSIPEQIAGFEAELVTLGKGGVADRRRYFLNKKIAELKKQLINL